MKQLTLIISFFLFVGCCNNPEVITYRFNDVEKEYIPYRLNQDISFVNNSNESIDGAVIEKNITIETYETSDCSETSYEKITAKIQLNNSETFYITLVNNNLFIPFVISHTKNNIQKDYTTIYNNFSSITFSNISFNNSNFENAILLNTYNEKGETVGNIVYSKTNGIEFILFEDGTWYKRVE